MSTRYAAQHKVVESSVLRGPFVARVFVAVNSTNPLRTRFVVWRGIVSAGFPECGRAYRTRADRERERDAHK